MRPSDVETILRHIEPDLRAGSVLEPCTLLGGSGLTIASDAIDRCLPTPADRRPFIDQLRHGLWRTVDAFELEPDDIAVIMGLDPALRWIQSADPDANGLAATAFVNLPFDDKPSMLPADLWTDEVELDLAAWYAVCFHRLRRAGALAEASHTDRAPTHEVRSGQRIRRFQIGRRLGGGRLAEVYEATKPYLPESRYALKLQATESIRSDEYAAAAAAEHPHVIRVLTEIGPDRGGVPGYSITVFELGQTDLRSVLGMAEPEARSVLRGLAGALYGLHCGEPPSLARLHGDVKPANIVLVRDRWKLADFGSARAIKRLPSDGLFPLTEAYAAPELLRAYYEGSTEGIGTAVDMWAFGVTAVELLTGQRLYRSGAKIPAGLSDPALRLVEACLMPDRSERATAADAIHLVDALARPPQRSAGDVLIEHRSVAHAAGDNYLAAIRELGRRFDAMVSTRDRTPWLWAGCLELLNRRETDLVKRFLNAADHQQRFAPDPSCPGMDRRWLRPRQHHDLAELVGRLERKQS